MACVASLAATNGGSPTRLRVPIDARGDGSAHAFGSREQGRLGAVTAFGHPGRTRPETESAELGVAPAYKLGPLGGRGAEPARQGHRDSVAGLHPMKGVGG